MQLHRHTVQLLRQDPSTIEAFKESFDKWTTQVSGDLLGPSIVGYDDNNPPLRSEDDVIPVKNRGVTYPVEFPAYSIEKGELRVTNLYDEVARSTELGSAGQLKLLYKGQHLINDYRACRDYGLKNQSEVICLVTAPTADGYPDYKDGAADSKAKRKLIRNAKQRSKQIESDYITRSGLDNLTLKPKSSLAQLEAIAPHLETKILPLCAEVMKSSWSDRQTRDTELKKQMEMIQKEAFLNWDNLDRYGDIRARLRRKDLIKETQGRLSFLEECASEPVQQSEQPSAQTSSPAGLLFSSLLDRRAPIEIAEYSPATSSSSNLYETPQAPRTSRSHLLARSETPKFATSTLIPSNPPAIQLQANAGLTVSDFTVEGLEQEQSFTKTREISPDSVKARGTRSRPIEDEAKYPTDMATEFLLGGSPFERYKNFRSFLRLDASPESLNRFVAAGDTASITGILSANFELVAQKEFEWLHELLDIGCSFDEMARLLIDGENASPWILLERRIDIEDVPSIGFHQENCVHPGGKMLDLAPRMINNAYEDLIVGSEMSSAQMQETVSELSGLAGALPLSSDIMELDWMSCVHFSGDNNCVATIAYADGNLDTHRAFHVSVIRIKDALRRALSALGFLQKNGVCCDAFTILQMHQESDVLENDRQSPQVEMSRMEVSNVEHLYLALDKWDPNLTVEENQEALCTAALISRETIATIIDGNPPATSPDENSLLLWLHECSLAAQIISVGILSFAQAHVGRLHPGFLVESLQKLHLQGTGAREQPDYTVSVELVGLTCVGDMLQRRVLVFSSFPTVWATDQVKYDALASPEDIADTWGPARFIADITPEQSRKIYGIEIGGGMITRADSRSQRLHWSALNSSNPNLLTFEAGVKHIIGGVNINDQCPLNEAESWRLPGTNACLQNLGTHQGGWELRERQVGLQGGQYAVLAFNVTYIKQNGVTLKDRQLMLPSNEIDIAFLNSACGLQISFCTGVARRVALRELLADVMIEFVESKVSKPEHWKELKTTHSIVDNFRKGSIEHWFDELPVDHRQSAIHIVRSMLEVLKDTGLDRNGEELVIAWIRRESPYSCLRIRCEKTSLWARILADSEDCATFACITPLCLEIHKHNCRGLAVAPWHNVSNLLDTAVCPRISNRGLSTVVSTLAPWKLEHQVSYWIGKAGSNLIAKVWVTNDPEPRLVVRQKVIPERYRSRLPKSMADRLGRLREQQFSNAVASHVVILAEMP